MTFNDRKYADLLLSIQIEHFFSLHNALKRHRFEECTVIVSIKRWKRKSSHVVWLHRIFFCIFRISFSVNDDFGIEDCPSVSFFFFYILIRTKLSHFTFIASIWYYWFGNHSFELCDRWANGCLIFLRWQTTKAQHITLPWLCIITCQGFFFIFSICIIRWPSQVEPIMVIYFCFRTNYKGISSSSSSLVRAWKEKPWYWIYLHF